MHIVCPSACLSVSVFLSLLAPVRRHFVVGRPCLSVRPTVRPSLCAFLCLGFEGLVAWFGASTRLEARGPGGVGFFSGSSPLPDLFQHRFVYGLLRPPVGCDSQAVRRDALVHGLLPHPPAVTQPL